MENIDKSTKSLNLVSNFSKSLKNFNHTSNKSLDLINNSTKSLKKINNSNKSLKSISNDKKTRNIDLIKSYIISQPDKIKNLVNFYNRIINIFIEYITITQIYSNKLKELAVKIKLNDEEEQYPFEIQLFNIIKTILFFNSESLNEIINDIKKEMILFNNDNLTKINDKLNNLSKLYFSEINKVILNQKKYEKEMKNYEELLINQEIKNNINKNKNKKEDLKIYNINIINEEKGSKEVFCSQENYFKCVKKSNNILKKIINISSEAKGNIRENINKKCNFIIDTLIFFTKKQNENYELQKTNIEDTYSSNIHILEEEEELNKHFIHPLPYSLKCLDIYIKKKEKKKKRKSEQIENNIFFSLINTEDSSENDKNVKNKIRELKRDNILNIVETITKNKIVLSLRDEKIQKMEINKKIIKQIITMMFKEKNKYNEEQKTKLFKFLNEEKEYILYFFKILNNHRAKENTIVNKDTFQFLGEAFEYIAKISLIKEDVEIFKLLFILSTTYYYKENNDKKYLFMYIKKFKEFQEKEFWDNYFENFIKFELKNTLLTYGPINEKNKSNEEIKKEKDHKYKISLFSNLLMVIQNMIDFGLNNSFINEFVQNVNNKYKLNKKELDQIELYLKENDDINNTNGNEEQKIEEDKKDNEEKKIEEDKKDSFNNIDNINNINKNEEFQLLKDEEKYINEIKESNEDKSINNLNINVINSVK